MKKWVKFLLASMALLVAAYWGYKQLKDTPSLLGKIHVDADRVLKVGIHDIKEALAWDAVTAPGYYYDNLKFSDSEEKTDSLEQGKGIDLTPYNLVLYTIPTVKNTVFTTLEIEDSVDFEAYIKRELAYRNSAVEAQDNGSYHYAIVPKSKIAIAWNKKYLALALSPNMPMRQLHTVFKAVLNDNKTIQDKAHPLIQQLSGSDDHMVYVDGESRLGLNFEDGAANLKGVIYTESPQRFQPEITIETVPEASFQVYFDGNFENTDTKNTIAETLESISFFEKNQLDVSKVLDRTNGFLSVAIKGKTTQIDTIISYTYDDNFEKVAKKEVQQKEVPRIHMVFGAKNESLRDYLEEQDALGPEYVFEPFPLYQLYVKEDALHTRFDTFKGTINTQEQIRKAFFSTEIDFQRLSNDLGVPQWNQYLAALKDFQLQAFQEADDQVIVQGTLAGWENNINIISQWAFSKSKEAVQN